MISNIASNGSWFGEAKRSIYSIYSHGQQDNIIVHSSNRQAFPKLFLSAVLLRSNHSTRRSHDEARNNSFEYYNSINKQTYKGTSKHKQTLLID
jgi:hypothetical protein